MLLSPVGPALDMAANRSYPISSVINRQNEILGTLDYLCKLRSLTSGNLEIRTSKFLFGHGSIAVDPGSARGILYMSNYPFKTGVGSKPKFILRAQDGYWYDFFRKEMQSLWENGIDWDCNQVSEKA
jgi:hypothetical protein